MPRRPQRQRVSSLQGDALWLDPGSPIIGLAFHNGQISVNGGQWHGFCQTYQNVALKEECMVICFGGEPPYSQHSCFEDQIPHHLKPCGGHVYRNYNNKQLMVFGNIDYPVTVASSDIYGIESDPDGFQCQMAFLHCHPSKDVQRLRLGQHKGLSKVCFDRNEPTGTWSILKFPDIVQAPTGIDRSGDILSISFDWNGCEWRQRNTLYGLLLGTTDVYRAIGTLSSCNSKLSELSDWHIYCDSKLSELSDWHIVLLGTAVWHKCWPVSNVNLDLFSILELPRLNVFKTW